MRRCGGSPPTAKLPHFSEEVPAGNKSPKRKKQIAPRNSRPWHALQNPEPTGKGKGRGNPTKTTANHPNPELPRTQKLEPRRLAGTICDVAGGRHSTKESLNVKAFLNANCIVYDTGSFFFSGEGLSQGRPGGIVVYERQEVCPLNVRGPQLQANEVRQELTLIVSHSVRIRSSFNIRRIFPINSSNIIFKESSNIKFKIFSQRECSI